MPILTELNLYPVKSCAGIALREAVLTPAGLMVHQIYDREWMVVDLDGNFMTQREHPRMALIVPRIKADTLELRAPGMLRLEVPLGLPAPEDEQTLQVKVWNETVTAYDCDATTAAWFSNFLGTPCRLVRFHAEAQRHASAEWTGEVEAPTLFSDGFPMLVISEESLGDLNHRLHAQGREALPMNRFRPNLVISGIGAFEEDHAQEIRIGAARLKPVKPCPRCGMPAIDQATGIPGPDPLDILQAYRANATVGGAIAFGMNAILLEGEGQVLRVGQEVGLELAF
jgi:uncharacterized protein